MAVPGPLYLGTSGWAYRNWAAGFYAGNPAKTWLKSYAERFKSVEVNRTFYRQVRFATLETWHRETPADFRFSLKAQRYLTHVRRLRFGPEALHRQKTAASPLGGKLAAVLWQLPPGLSHDPARLESFFSLLREWREVPPSSSAMLPGSGTRWPRRCGGRGQHLGLLEDRPKPPRRPTWFSGPIKDSSIFHLGKGFSAIPDSPAVLTL